MVASTASGASPIPRLACPLSSVNQYLTSPSGAPVTTCCTFAVCEPAALLNESFEFRASCTAEAHSSERYLTPTTFLLPHQRWHDEGPTRAELGARRSIPNGRFRFLRPWGQPAAC